MQLDKKVIGHEFKPFSTTVEAGKVKLLLDVQGVGATAPGGGNAGGGMDMKKMHEHSGGKM